MGSAQSTETKVRSFTSSNSESKIITSSLPQETPKRRNSCPDGFDVLDPRSPSQQRTPLREVVVPALSLFDPRSPLEGRTPLKVVEKKGSSTRPKSAQIFWDPRSPLEGRTPIHHNILSLPSIFLNDPRSPMEQRTPLPQVAKIIPSPSSNGEQSNPLETPYQPSRSKFASRIANIENILESGVEDVEEEEVQKLDLEESMVVEPKESDEFEEITLENTTFEEPAVEENEGNEVDIDSLDESINNISQHLESMEMNQSPFVMRTTPVNSPLRVVNKSARKQVSSVENSPVNVVQISVASKVLSPNSSPLSVRKQTPQKNQQKFVDGKENVQSPLKIQNISSSPLKEKNVISASKVRSPVTSRRLSFTPSVAIR